MIVFFGICADVLHENGHVVTSACGHVYHSSCINTWLIENGTCPECRQIIRGKPLKKIYFNVRVEDSSDLEDEVENRKKVCSDSITECQQFKTLKGEFKLAAELFGKRVLKGKDIRGSLKKGVKLLASMQDYAARIDEENDQLRNKVDELRDMDILISGSRRDVRNVAEKFNQERNVVKMAKCFIVMKKKLNRALESKSDLEKKVERITRTDSFIQQERETREWMIKLQQETRKTVKKVSRLLRNQERDAPESKRKRNPDSSSMEASHDLNMAPDAAACSCGQCPSNSEVSNMSNTRIKPSTYKASPQASTPQSQCDVQANSVPIGRKALITVDATPASNNNRSSILIRIPPSVLKAQQGDHEIQIRLGIDGIMSDLNAAVSFQ